MGIHEVVDANAILLDNAVAAIGRLEAQMAVVVANADQTTADVKSLKEYAEQEDARLERMGARLETANTELTAKLAALEGMAISGGKGGSTGGPTDLPGLDNMAPAQATIQSIEQTLRGLSPGSMASRAPRTTRRPRSWRSMASMSTSRFSLARRMRL